MWEKKRPFSLTQDILLPLRKKSHSIASSCVEKDTFEEKWTWEVRKNSNGSFVTSTMHIMAVTFYWHRKWGRVNFCFKKKKFYRFFNIKGEAKKNRKILFYRCFNPWEQIMCVGCCCQITSWAILFPLPPPPPLFSVEAICSVHLVVHLPLLLLAFSCNACKCFLPSLALPPLPFLHFWCGSLNRVSLPTYLGKPFSPLCWWENKLNNATKI